MNHLVVLGLNYHSSPIAIRERFTIPESCLTHALHALARMPHLKEVVVLSTCNRTEVYAMVSDVQAGLKEIEAFFLSTQAVADHEVLTPNFRLLREDVALHLMRVASGLDSIVLGEGQIMAQVKASHQAALEAGTAGPFLDQLFKMSLACGKRVRTETSMGKRAVSISSAAVELARNVLGALNNRTVLVVGAGKMAQICIKLLLNEKGAGSIYVINRTKEKLDTFLQNDLPNKHRLKTGFSLKELGPVAGIADLIIVSTSAPQFLLTKDNFAAVNDEKKTCIIDISVPRNVDPALNNTNGIKLFHADDLASLVNHNLAEREALVADAQNIVFEALDEYDHWQRSLLVVPTITELRQKIEAIRHAQVEKRQGQSDSLSDGDSKQQLEEISRAIINQILHHPTVQLKSTRDYEILKQQAEALRTLFALEPPKSPLKEKHAAAKGTCPVAHGGGDIDSNKLMHVDQALKEFSTRFKASLVELR